MFLLNEAYTKDTDGEWHLKNDKNWTYDYNTQEQRMLATFGSDLVNTPYTGFRLKFSGRPMQNALLIDAGYYAVMTISVQDSYITGSTSVNERYCNVAIYDDLGNTYTIRTSPVYTTFTENGATFYNWNVSLVGQIGSGDKAYINKMVIESNLPSGNLGMDGYNVSMRFQIAETATEAQRIHEEQLQAIDDAANTITSNQDANTDKIIANDDENTNSLLAKLQGVLDSILQLPQKIWDKFLEGLKALFVPNSGYISGFLDSFDTLLSERFGGVYQAAGIIKDLLIDVIAVDRADDTITLPVTTIPLPGNQEFSFGGYQVDIIPAGLEDVLWYVKLSVGIVATILFINILRILYDEVMGVEDQR